MRALESYLSLDTGNEAKVNKHFNILEIIEPPILEPCENLPCRGKEPSSICFNLALVW